MGGLLSFASPKESNQRKGDPDFALILRFSLLAGVFERALRGPSKTGGILAATLRAYPPKAAMLGAKNGRKPFHSRGTPIFYSAFFRRSYKKPLRIFD